SECYPFVKTGGLADVMGALPKALKADGIDVRVILPKYGCIPERFKEQMQYITHFYMRLGTNPFEKYVGIMGCELDGIKYYFIDNEEYYSYGNPYTDIINDIERYVFFSKAVLAALPVIDFLPDIIHCHDWQASLIPVYLRTLFKDTEMAHRAKTVLTIHNLKFQGIHGPRYMYNLTGLPEYVFGVNDIIHNDDANMLKGGIVFADKVTTVSETYAWEITTPEYGESLEGVLSYYQYKLCGIVNGIDYEVYDPQTDRKLFRNYSSRDFVSGKRENKIHLQEELGLEVKPDKFVIGLISRLTDQKGLDLVSAIIDRVIDGNTQFILIGTGDPYYEDMFRSLEYKYKGQVSSNIMYSDERARKLYAAADAMLVPSRFEPCGLTQLMSFRYGALPIVRETGGLRDTVQPYNEYEESGNGFSFDRYDAGLLLNTINYAKEIYFTRQKSWRGIVRRAITADYSWKVSAQKYIWLYNELTSWS
ncbi:MAG: glycogen/starch synthase, partial [Eubacteriales bacterium]|nr:glycogen/starch synthase [Eubacteriales bacterium]